jgi:hypothetical protein
MKVSTITLAAALALSSTYAMAQSSGSFHRSDGREPRDPFSDEQHAQASSSSSSWMERKPL